MNINPIISLPAGAALVASRRVKVDNAGAVVYAGAADRAIGTTLQDYASGTAADIHLVSGGGLHFATIGSNTAVAKGDALEAAADGQLVKQNLGKVVAVALEGSSSTGSIIRVVYLAETAGSAATLVATGIHAWAGGAATADSIAVAGLEATDVVLATLVARAAAETLVMAANDGGNDQIDLTLSANGTNGTTKIAYAVYRPAA